MVRDNVGASQNFQKLVEVASIAEREHGIVVASLMGQKRKTYTREGSRSWSP